MSNVKEIEAISEIRKLKIYELEEQNIKNILNKVNKNNCERQKNKDNWITKKYNLCNYIVYELIEKDSDLKDSTILVSSNELKKLSWMDLIQIREEKNDWKTNIEQGIWIASYKNKIRYTIVLNKKIVIALQIQKVEDKTILSYFTETEEIEKQLQENLKDKVLLINILKGIEYKNPTIEKLIKDFDINCITINQNEMEKQILIEEKQELQKNVDILTEQINSITKQINEISRQADSAEKEAKKTIEEINRVTKENENLKNSIMNVRKTISKKCAYLPIIGRILIKELNKEFGERALPNG